MPFFQSILWFSWIVISKTLNCIVYIIRPKTMFVCHPLWKIRGSWSVGKKSVFFTDRDNDIFLIKIMIQDDLLGCTNNTTH